MVNLDIYIYINGTNRKEVGHYIGTTYSTRRSSEWDRRELLGYG
jgi:hypothetical protein